MTRRMRSHLAPDNGVLILIVPVRCAFSKHLRVAPFSVSNASDRSNKQTQGVVRRRRNSEETASIRSSSIDHTTSIVSVHSYESEKSDDATPFDVFLKGMGFKFLSSPRRTPKLIMYILAKEMITPPLSAEVNGSGSGCSSISCSTNNAGVAADMNSLSTEIPPKSSEASDWRVDARAAISAKMPLDAYRYFTSHDFSTVPPNEFAVSIPVMLV
jgi:hypothetical protein